MSYCSEVTLHEWTLEQDCSIFCVTNKCYNECGLLRLKIIPVITNAYGLWQLCTLKQQKWDTLMRHNTMHAIKKISTHPKSTPCLELYRHIGMKCNVVRCSQRSALLQLIKSCQSHLMHYSAPECFRLSQIACWPPASMQCGLNVECGWVTGARCHYPDISLWEQYESQNYKQSLHVSV